MLHVTRETGWTVWLLLAAIVVPEGFAIETSDISWVSDDLVVVVPAVKPDEPMHEHGLCVFNERDTCMDLREIKFEIVSASTD